MEDKDIIVDYIITKDTEKVNMEKLMNFISYFVQNNASYYAYDPNFVDGVLMLGIVGYRSEHDKLMKTLGKQIINLGCTIKPVERIKDNNA